MFDVFYKDQINSIEDACKICRTRYLWILDSNNDYSEFDFSWEPAPWEAEQTHVWPSQHQKNGGTLLVPKPGATEKNYNHPIVKRTGTVPRLHIKHIHGSPNEGDVNTRYISDYLSTMRRALAKTDWEYCWVTADVCSYADFDFTWHPSEWQLDMLHVFPSNEQKFGDTFYVHVPSFLEKTEKLEILEWFETLHFVSDIPVKRYTDTVQYNTDSLVDAVWNHKFRSPVVQFYKYNLAYNPTISLWQEKLKNITPLKKGGESTLVPREAKNYLKTQLYDYPYVDKSYMNQLNGLPLDIVFISNGESNADRNWEHLCKCTQNIPNRVVRVDGVKGRAESYRAGLEASNTDWAFCVFAKLEVDANFDWNWQPDRLQVPKHYIFYAENPVNGLVYGHMAMIAANKKLVMKNDAKGLDFTMNQEHEVVPVLSGIARYADDPWIAWRSAFRECIKLYHSLPDIDNEYRLNQWLEVNLKDDVTGEWSIRGAQDAIDYYDSVQGSFDALKLTYEWAWLEEYFTQRYNQSPDQLCTQFLNHSVQGR